MIVSVVIPTYNSEKTLEKCLKSIGKQTYGNIEIIAVDEFSEDETVEIAKSYGAKIIQDYGERTRAKNIGLKISALTFIGCIAYLFYDWRKEKGDRWAKKLENRVKSIFLKNNVK